MLCIQSLFLYCTKIWVRKKQLKRSAFENQQTLVYVVKSDEIKTRHVQNWPVIKNPHFWSYPHETLWKWLSHEVIIFTKFHEDMTKNVDFSSLANFWECLVFISSDFSKVWYAFMPPQPTKLLHAESPLLLLQQCTRYLQPSNQPQLLKVGTTVAL